MDELDRLAAFRSDVPDPLPDTVSRARRRLLREVADSRMAPPRRRSRRAIVVGVAAAVVIAGVATAAAVGWGGSAPRETEGAAVLLLAASRTAANGPVTTVAAGQYIYVRQVGSGATIDGDVTYLQSKINETWFPADGIGSGRLRITYGEWHYVGDTRAGRTATYGIQPPSPGSQRTWTIPPDQTPGEDLAEPSYAFLQTLPTDPNRLYDLISDYARNRGVTQSQEMLDTVASLLTWSIAPPRLRAALYEVAARIPGVTLLGPAVDASGRHGTALAVTARGTRDELIFDPSTAALLGRREVVVEDPYGFLPPGTVLADAAITISVVDAPGATTPAGTAGTTGTTQASTTPPR